MSLATLSAQSSSWCNLSGDVTTSWGEKEREWWRDNKSEWQSSDFNQYFQPIAVSPPLFVHVTWHHAAKSARPQRGRRKDWCSEEFTSANSFTSVTRDTGTHRCVCLSDWTDSELSWDKIPLMHFSISYMLGQDHKGLNSPSLQDIPLFIIITFISSDQSEGLASWTSRTRTFITICQPSYSHQCPQMCTEIS